MLIYLLITVIVTILSVVITNDNLNNNIYIQEINPVEALTIGLLWSITVPLIIIVFLIHIISETIISLIIQTKNR
jgi:hypothetical protein